MRSVQISIVVCAVLLIMGLSACGHERMHDDEDISVSVPIHMAIPAGNHNHSMGLSGFIFGTFLLLGAYGLIIGGCVLLIIKDNIIKQLVTFAAMAGQMFHPKWQQGSIMRIANKFLEHDFRLRCGAVGLIGGVILAYIGAWIAL